MESNDLIRRGDIYDAISSMRVTMAGKDIFPLESRECVLAHIATAPAVDAVTVGHGEIIWKNRKKLVKRYDTEPCCFDAEANPLYHATNKHITEKVAYCPVCKKRMNGDFLNFCDNCGARTDGKEPTDV